jgi:twitching motility two-component system response regulator PilH
MDDDRARSAEHVPPRVLLADDDPWIRESFGFLLRDTGYVVLDASDGVEALDVLLLSEEPLIVVLDLLMPRMTGYEVLQRVASDEALQTRHAYVVCAAHPSNQDRIGEHVAHLLASLDAPFILRPCDIEVLSRRWTLPPSAFAQGAGPVGSTSWRSPLATAGRVGPSRARPPAARL